MNIESGLQTALSGALQQLYGLTAAPETLVLQATRKEFAGSHTFVTFPFAKAARLAPPELGRALGEFLQTQTELVSDYNVVQGFLNLTLADAVWLDIYRQLETDERWGLPAAGETVMVEFSSPNTNKPLHLGHLRNNFLGFAVAEILEAVGHKVIKANLANDRGIHICKSMLAYQDAGGIETPESTGLKGDHLVGKYYVAFDKTYREEVQQRVAAGMGEEEAKKTASALLRAQEMLLKWEQNDPETVALWQKLNGWVYEGFAQTYHRMGVSFDQYYYESNTYLLGKEIVEEGLQKGVFYRKPDGSVWIDLTAEGLDEKLVLRADGTSVYITQDLGTADLKYRDFGLDRSVYVVGNEQDYHFKVLFAILKKLGKPYAEGLYHLSYGMVDLPTGRMKTREGTVVDADDLMNEMVQTAKAMSQELGKIDEMTPEQAEALYEMVGIGALKYFLVKVEPRKRMLFNPAESIDLHGHTATAIQYTYARTAAIVRKGMEENYNSSARPAELHSAERLLICLLAELPARLLEAARNYAPSVLAQYAYDLAREYNRFYSEVSIFQADSRESRDFRIALTARTGKTIKQTMKLLGIGVPERM